MCLALQLCLLALLCLRAFVLLQVGGFGCVAGFGYCELMISFMVVGFMVISVGCLGFDFACLGCDLCLVEFGFLLDLLLRLVVSVFGCDVVCFGGLLFGYGCYCMLICVCICDFLFVVIIALVCCLVGWLIVL